MTTALLRSYPPFTYISRPSASPFCSYTLVDLGLHQDGAPLLPIAINGRHEICASSASVEAMGMVRGFCVTGATRTPTSLAFGQSPVTSLSDSGHLAGATGATSRELRAWASHLGIFGDELWPGSVSIARGVNSAGQVTGNVLFDTGEFSLSRAFVLSASDRARFVTPPQGGTTVAAGINDAGDVVFNAAPLGAPPGETKAWCLRGEQYIEIASLGGGRTWATAVTPEGRVVGHSLTSRGDTHAFLWEEGRTVDLGTVHGAMSQALAANDNRVVVGRIVTAESGPRACRWTPDTGLVLLEEIASVPPGWVLHEAVGINRAGVIVGVGMWHGEPRGFVLRPQS